MSEHYHQKTWWQRHRIWLIPTIIIIAAIAILFTRIGTTVKDFGSTYLNPSIYEDALAIVREHDETKDLLGDPIQTLFLVEGEVEYSDNGNSAKMTIPIKGAKTHGKMDIQAAKVSGKWVYKLIAIRTKKPEVHIKIIDSL